ncbi:MAG: hypothetical protein JWQ87_2011 [Candidatus Sulfotelmatobacter sp.]|nr:hypothetical protein [Candidatus Sulfotelmatobacter sp.]
MASSWSRAALIGWAAIIFVLLGYELWCIFSGDKETPPLTYVTVRYVPWWVVMPFLFWLLVHFGVHYAAAGYKSFLKIF